MKIFKYKIEVGSNEIRMPRYAKIISAGLDNNDDMCIWAIVNEEREKEKRVILVTGTGWSIGEFKENGRGVGFIGTIRKDPYMWHVLEVF